MNTSNRILETSIDEFTIMSADQLDGVTDLHIIHGSSTPDDVVKLAASRNLQHIVKLAVSTSTPIGDDGLISLANSQHTSQLESLAVPYNQVTNSGLAALLDGAIAPRLKHLDLAGNAALGNDAARLLGESAKMPLLESLELGDTGVGARGLLYLATSPHLPRLASFNLSGSLFIDTATSLQELLSAPTVLPNPKWDKEVWGSEARKLEGKPITLSDDVTLTIDGFEGRFGDFRMSPSKSGEVEVSDSWVAYLKESSPPAELPAPSKPGSDSTWTSEVVDSKKQKPQRDGI